MTAVRCVLPVASGLCYTDGTVRTKQTSKRGLPTKWKVQMRKPEQMLKHEVKPDMTFASFYEIYAEDKKRRTNPCA